jgi:hypothetical protein
MLSCWFLVLYVDVVTRVPQLVRRSGCLLCLYKDDNALQPKGGDHVYLSSRRNINP